MTSLTESTEAISSIINRDPNEPRPRDPDDVAGAIQDLPEAVGESVSAAVTKEQNKPISVKYDKDGRIVSMGRVASENLEDSSTDLNAEEVEERDEDITSYSEEPKKDAQTEKAEQTEQTEYPDQIEIEPSMLAEVLGLGEKDLVVGEEGIAIRAKVDGKVEEVPLSTLKDSYQLISTGRQRLAAFSEEKKSFEEKKKKEIDGIELQKNFFAQAIADLEQQYANEFKQINWQQLREEDRDQYSLLKQDHEERFKEIEKYKTNLIKAHHSLEQQKLESRKEILEEGSRRLQNIFSGSDYARAPKWDDSEQSALSNWMVEAGFTNEQIKNADSHLIFKWARDSMLREKERDLGQKAVKKVSNLPKLKLSKSGSRASGKISTAAIESGVEIAKKNQRKAARIHRGSLGGRSNMNETVALIEQLLKPVKK